MTEILKTILESWTITEVENEIEELKNKYPELEITFDIENRAKIAYFCWYDRRSKNFTSKKIHRK